MLAVILLSGSLLIDSCKNKSNSVNNKYKRKVLYLVEDIFTLASAHKKKIKLVKVKRHKERPSRPTDKSIL